MATTTRITILDEILAHKRLEVAAAMRARPFPAVEDASLAQQPARPFTAALRPAAPESVPRLIAEISAGCELWPGDVIITGTPAGVGFARKPPEYLAAGDSVEVEIEGIGTLRNRVEWRT